MIDPKDALSLGAEVAVALTGFTGIVAVFGSGAVHEWDEADRFRLRLLLVSSMSPLAMSLIGLLLLSTDLEAGAIWRTCSAIAVVGFIFSAVYNTRTFRSIGIVKINAVPGSNLVFLWSSIASIAVGLLQMANILVLAAFWPFFTDIVFLMLLALLQFARLVLLRPSHSTGSQ